jgi:hypothetical protein
MQHDYEDLHDIDGLDDNELRALIIEQLADQPTLDISDITVKVKDGEITLAGRVGTEGERRIADHVLTDVLGIMEFTNDLVIDPIRRAESPEAIDEHLVDEELRAGALLGDAPVPFSPEAEHLAGERESDLTGTADYNKVMEDGMTWNPPSGPTPEGVAGEDAGPADMGERH